MKRRILMVRKRSLTEIGLLRWKLVSELRLNEETLEKRVMIQDNFVLSRENNLVNV